MEGLRGRSHRHTSPPNGTPFYALGSRTGSAVNPRLSKIRQYGAHFFGDLTRERVDLTGPSVIARRTRAGHDAQTLDHEPTAQVLALRAEDWERLTGVWQGEALSGFTSRDGNVRQAQVNAFQRL